MSAAVIRLVLTVAGPMVVAGVAFAAPKPSIELPPTDPEHEAAVARANLAVENGRARVENDPLRPLYHVVSASQWMNDPNGPVHHRGVYHLFFQHNPYGDVWGHMHWGHVRSRDLVHWERLPIALAPSTARGEEHCFSGSSIVDPDGRLRLLYTSIGKSRPPEQWGAIAIDPSATVFRKLPQNPLLTLEAHGDLEIDEWRDPFVFREAGRTFMVVGGRRRGGTGLALLYETNDLVRWRFLSVVAEGTEETWECPLLFKLGATWVLVYSPYSWPIVETGRLDLTTLKFTAKTHDKLTRGSFYAPNVTRDAKGRWLMWGWIRELPKGRGWSGALSLPRVVSVGADGTLTQTPAPELKALRGKAWRRPDGPIEETVRVPDLEGDTLELEATLDLGYAKSVGLRVRVSPDGGNGLDLIYDGKTLDVAGARLDLPPDLAGKPLPIRVFLDRAVLEVFVADGRLNLAQAIGSSPKHVGIELVARGGVGRIRGLRSWTMTSVWR